MSKLGYINVTGIISPDKADKEDSNIRYCSAIDIERGIIENKNATELLVAIDSNGGSCDQGFAAYNYLTTSGKEITTRAVGACASIATVVLLAGKKRQGYKNTRIMIHLPMVMPYEPVNEIELLALQNQLAQEKERILNLYIQVTGSTREQLEPLMVEGTYLKAEEARDLGFLTEIIDPIMAINTEKIIMKKNTSTAAKVLKGLAQLLNVELTDDVVNVDLTTTDGKVLSIDPALEVGATVMMDGADAPDGDYTMESGEVITVASGKITAIVTPASDDAKDQQIADLQAKLDALTATNQTLTETNNTLTADVDALKNENATVAKNVEAIEAHLKTLNIDFKAKPTTTFNKGKEVVFDAAAEKARKAEIKAKAGKVR